MQTNLQKLDQLLRDMHMAACQAQLVYITAGNPNERLTVVRNLAYEAIGELTQIQQIQWEQLRAVPGRKKWWKRIV